MFFVQTRIKESHWTLSPRILHVHVLHSNVLWLLRHWSLFLSYNRFLIVWLLNVVLFFILHLAYVQLSAKSWMPLRRGGCLILYVVFSKITAHRERPARQWDATSYDKISENLLTVVICHLCPHSGPRNHSYESADSLRLVAGVWSYQPLIPGATLFSSPYTFVWFLFCFFAAFLFFNP